MPDLSKMVRVRQSMAANAPDNTEVTSRYMAGADEYVKRNLELLRNNKSKL